MKILIVLTSHNRLGRTGKKTGFWLEEFAAPYYVLSDAGALLTLASPQGGKPPLDPKSDEPNFQTQWTQRFKQDTKAQNQLAHTIKLADASAHDFDAVFYPGGHGPMWDLVIDVHSIALIKAMLQSQKPVACVCHAPAVFLNVTDADGHAFIHGKSVTGFSNSEEDAVELSDIVPFLLEDELKAKGANYSKVTDWQPYAITDGYLITGQNPASSEQVAEQLLAWVKPY